MFKLSLLKKFTGLFLTLAVISVLIPGALPARAAAAKKVALAPIAIRGPQDMAYLSQGIQDMLVSRLASEEIVLVAPAEVDLAMTGLARPLTPKGAAEVVAKTKADFVVYGTMLVMGKNYSLNWSVLKAEDPGKPIGLARTTDENGLIDTVDEMALMVRGVVSGRPPTTLVAKSDAAPAEAGDKKAEEKKTAASASPLFSAAGAGGDPSDPLATGQGAMASGVFEVHPMSPTPMTMAAADLTGDGNDEILVLSLKSIGIYTRVNGQLKQLVRLPSPMQGRLLMVSAGDVDRDGKAEIALTNLYGQFPSGAIFKLQGSRLVKVTEKSRHHLRIIKSPKGAMIVGQEALMSRFYYGDFIRYALIGKELRRAGTLPGHKNIEFPTLVMADLDRDGGMELIGLNYEEKLTVVSAGGAVLYRSPKFFGGTNNKVQPDRQGGDMAERQYDINSGLDVADLDGDGKMEVVVTFNHETTNRIVEKMRYYNKGSVFALKWDNNIMRPAWRTPEVQQYLAAVKIVEAADGAKTLVAVGSDPVAFSGLMNIFDEVRGYMFLAPVSVGKGKNKQ